VLVGARCAQLAPAGDDGKSAGRRYGLSIAALAAAWISAVALIGPLLVDRELSESKAAAASGNIGSAIDHARTARSIEPWASSPYLQLGLLTELEGDYPAAQVEYTQAIERENRNWQLYYLRSRAEEENAEAAAEAGDTATTRTSSEAAEADLEKARQLNPLGPELAKGVP
jgi:tetratricopeptide (TPR) repeat protein